eukprot:750502-Hanusia_phi.AAC.3
MEGAARDSALSSSSCSSSPRPPLRSTIRLANSCSVAIEPPAPGPPRTPSSVTPSEAEIRRR